jgi:hypothetical protein
MPLIGAKSCYKSYLDGTIKIPVYGFVDVLSDY